MSELRITEVKPEAKLDRYDEGVAGIAKEFVLCAACEDDFVVVADGKPAYCEGCKRTDEVLHSLYATRDVKPLQPREHVGVIEMPSPAPAFDLPERCLAGAKMGQLVAVAAATVIGGLTLFCLLGWYGLRAIAALGIWIAR